MAACRETLRRNQLSSAYIRPLVFIGDVGMGVNPPAGYGTDVILPLPPGSLSGEEALEQGIDAMVSSTASCRSQYHSDRGQGRWKLSLHCWWDQRHGATVIRRALRWMSTAMFLRGR